MIELPGETLTARSIRPATNLSAFLGRLSQRSSRLPCRLQPLTGGYQRPWFLPPLWPASEAFCGSLAKLPPLCWPPF